MAQIPVTQVRKESKLKGSKPRVGINIDAIEEWFSRSKEFTVKNIENGTDGVAVSGGLGQFTSAGATFVTNKVSTGDTLTITGGADAGTYIIQSIESETEIRVPGASFSGTTGNTYDISRIYTDEMDTAVSVEQSINQLGGLSRVSGMSFAINNQDLFSDKFDESGSNPNPENESIEGHLFFDDGTDIQWDEKITFFQGIISSFPEITYKKVQFRIENDDVIKDQLVSQIITEDIFTTTPFSAIGGGGIVLVVKNSNILGKMKQKVYGDHIHRLGHRNASKATATRNNNLVPLLYIGSDGSRAYFLVSEHELDLNDDSYDLEKLCWYEDTSLGRFVQLNKIIRIENNDNTNGCIISFTIPSNGVYSLYDYYYPEGTTSNDQSSGGHSWTNPDNAVDLDFTTKATSSLDGVTDNGKDAEIDADFDGYDNPETITEVSVWTKTSYTGSSATKVRQTFSVNGTNLKDNRSDIIYQAGTEAASNAGVNAEVTLLHRQNAAGGSVGSCEIYMVYKRIEYTKTLEDHLNGNLFFSCRGHRYDTWINGRATADGYTESHVDDDVVADYLLESGADGDTTTSNLSGLLESAGSTFQSNGVAAGDLIAFTDNAENRCLGEIIAVTAETDLYYILLDGQQMMDSVTALDFEIWSPSRMIENGAGVMEDIARNSLSLATANINEDTFNIASNDLSTTELMFIIVDDRMTYDLIDELARTLKSWVIFDSSNTFSMSTLVGGDPFSFTGDSVPGNEDIFIFDPESSMKITSGDNDRLYVDVTTISLTAGQYTGTTLAAHIESKLDDAFGANQINCTYSSTTGKFTFTEVAGGPYDFKWSTTSRQVGRHIGFDISADDTLLTTIVSDYPVWDDSFVEHPIVKGSFSIKKIEKVITDYTVQYSPDSKGQFNLESTVTDTTYHSATAPKVWKHPYTKDSITADLYRDHLKDRMNRKHWQVKFKTWLNAIGNEVFDVINIRHPVLTNLVSNVTTKKWFITSIKINFGNSTIGITAIEF